MAQLAAVLTLIAVASASEYDHRRKGRCEPITIPLCQDMPYNVTRMPNVVENDNQEEADVVLRQFTPLIDSNCSSHLRFFLCSLFAPMCSEMVDVPIPSCQSTCDEVKSKCLPLLKPFNMAWPPILNCSRLPVAERDQKGGLCMKYPTGAMEAGGGGTRPASLDPGHLISKYPHLDWAGLLEGAAGGQRQPSVATPPPAGPGCPAPHYLAVDHGTRPSVCQPACTADVHFTAADKQLTELWMAVWATLCFLSTLFTVLTFWIDTSRFKYPERPIVFISMCYNIYSLGYLLRLLLGAENVACDTSPGGQQFLIVEGLDSAGCIVTFLLLYYFGLASSLWWVVLTFTWYLSAGRKWSNESIQWYATYLHLASWGLPAVLTTVIITAQTISGQEASGLCYVSGRPLPLLGLVILPLALLLVSGSLFLALGYAALVKIRSTMRRDGTCTHKLETLMVRIGAYGVLYIVPAGCVVGCRVYEYMHVQRWDSAALAHYVHCTAAGGSCPPSPSGPPVALVMLRIFMSLIVGVVSGMWVWTSKTGSSWRRFCVQTCCGRRRHGTKNIAYLPAPTQAGGLPMASARPARPARTSTRTQTQRQVSQV